MASTEDLFNPDSSSQEPAAESTDDTTDTTEEPAEGSDEEATPEPETTEE